MMSSDNKQTEQEEINNITELSGKMKDMDAAEAVMRLERSRERNREHARKTRLRKKARLQSLQSRLIDLQQERSALKQNLEESNIASILLKLSSVNGNDDQNCCSSDNNNSPQLKNPEQVANPLKRPINTNLLSYNKKETDVDYVSSLNKDECNDKDESRKNMSTGSACRKEMKLLSAEEIESTRRERNRLHAKMTRERKKMLISRLEKSIMELEQENQELRRALPNKNPQESTQQVPLSIGISATPYDKIVASSHSISTQLSRLSNYDILKPGARSSPDDVKNTEECITEHTRQVIA